MQRCPICRGRINDNAACGRCGADLSLVIQTHEKAKKLTCEATRLMADGEFSQAETLLEESQLLEYTQFNQHVLEFIRNYIHDYELKRS